MKNDSTAADTMNAPTVARALPFVYLPLARRALEQAPTIT